MYRCNIQFIFYESIEVLLRPKFKSKLFKTNSMKFLNDYSIHKFKTESIQSRLVYFTDIVQITFCKMTSGESWKRVIALKFHWLLKICSVFNTCFEFKIADTVTIHIENNLSSLLIHWLSHPLHIFKIICWQNCIL